MSIRGKTEILFFFAKFTISIIRLIRGGNKPQARVATIRASSGEIKWIECLFCFVFSLISRRESSCNIRGILCQVREIVGLKSQAKR